MSAVSQKHFDVVVVGSGFSGLKAFQLAQQHSQSCALVAKDFGATQHFSGAFDLVDPRIFDARLRAFDFSLQDTFENFCKANPQHLYALLDVSFEALIQEMQSFFDFYNIPTAGNGKSGEWVVGSTGAFKPTAFALPTMAIPNEARHKNAKVLVVGFEGLYDYPLDLIQKNLEQFYNKVDVKSYAEFSVMPSSAYVSLIKHFQNAEAVLKFSEFLKPLANAYDLILVPPVFDLKNLASWPEGFAANVREMLSVLPSLAGLRLTNHLWRVFKDKQITFLKGTVESFSQNHNLLQSCEIKQDENSQELLAKEFVLATGKFIGGGVIEKQEKFHESLLNLDLYVGKKKIQSHTPPTRLIAQKAYHSQDILNLGVHFTESSRPKNLKVVGHVLTGFDFTRENCGFGISIASSLQNIQNESQIL